MSAASPKGDERAPLTAEEEERQRMEEERLMRPLLWERPNVKKNSEDTANFFSLLFLLYLGGMMSLAAEKDADMQVEDCETVCERDGAVRMQEDFEKLWKKAQAKPPEDRPYLFMLLFWQFFPEYLLLTFCSALECVGPFSTTVLMRYITTWCVDKRKGDYQAVIFAAILLGFQIISSIGTAQGFRIMARFTLRYQSILSMKLANKSIHLSIQGMKSTGGTGALFQIFSTDVTRVSMILPFVLHSSSVFFQVIGAFIYIFYLTHIAGFGGLAVFCIVVPLNYQISDSFIALYIKKMMAGDARTHKIVEIINSVRIIKFYAWEKPFKALISVLRKPELDGVYELMGKIAVLMFSFSVASPMIQLAIFVILMTAYENDMSVLVFFQCLSLINILGLGMLQIPFLYSSWLQLKVSSGRLMNVLVADERSDLEDTSTDEKLSVGDACIENGDFTWGVPPPAPPGKGMMPPGAPPPSPPAAGKGPGKPPGPTEPIADPSKPGSPSKSDEMVVKEMKGVNFEAHKGELVMVVGKVGAGKSSLMGALLTEMICKGGVVGHKGTVAYVPQQAWIINATVRNNILVDIPFNEEKYNQALDAVDLVEDLKALPNGDLTEIGEKGINLSGGQRQRVSLARALYQDADIYIFDDPLSALDAHVGRHVFYKAISDILKTKTRVLVTHQMAYLSHATRVYMVDNMTVNLEKYDGNMSSASPALKEMLVAWNKTAGSSEASPLATPPSCSPTSADKAPTKKAIKHRAADMQRGKLTVQEERQSGSVKATTFFGYLASFGGLPFWGVMLFLHAIVIGFNIFGQLWMGYYAEGRDLGVSKDTPAIFYLGIYAAAIACSAIFVFIRELIWRVGAVNAPRNIYENMTSSMLCAPMSFFDTTPVGRVINRFTKDADMLDFTVPMSANSTMSLFFTQLGSIISICVMLPWFSPIAVACGIILFFLQPTVATVVIRRLNNAAAGPVAALYSEMLSGTLSIRSTGKTEFFLRRFAQRVDDQAATKYFDLMLFESVKVRINLLMGVMTAAIVLIMIALRSKLTPTKTSYVLTQSVQLTSYMGYAMLQRGQLMMSLNSVERLMEYCELPAEPNGSQAAPQDWPAQGAIEFRNLTAQYRPGLPNVLEGVSLNIKPGEKIGVCGRTGSGKSSMLLTIFRLLPILEGSEVLIDNIDTASMPLEQLRSHLSAIPQEPTLFNGTVRENLDPFKAQQDERLVEALAECHLKQALEEKLPAGATNILDMKLTDKDLSTGQKQMMCMARAVARNMKILVLDEATSSVDVHTDALIQQTIRTVFKACTVITVAHRLNTIMDSDRILVLDQGRVAEFATPAQLLADSNSLFSRLVSEAADESEH